MLLRPLFVSIPCRQVSKDTHTSIAVDGFTDFQNFPIFDIFVMQKQASTSARLPTRSSLNDFRHDRLLSPFDSAIGPDIPCFPHSLSCAPLFCILHAQSHSFRRFNAVSSGDSFCTCNASFFSLFFTHMRSHKFAHSNVPITLLEDNLQMKALRPTLTTLRSSLLACLTASLYRS